MRVLVACEFSGRVRDAFRARGHEAVSCDLLPTEVEGPHYQGDVRDILEEGWDLMIAHPPCTRLSFAGAHLFKLYPLEIAESLAFVRQLMDAPIHRIAIENPRSLIHTRIRPRDEEIQPWMFGDPFRKATWLWLKHLPPLMPSRIIAERLEFVNEVPGGKEQWKIRSRTFPGIAAAMAEQWGRLQP